MKRWLDLNPTHSNRGRVSPTRWTIGSRWLHTSKPTRGSDDRSAEPLSNKFASRPFMWGGHRTAAAAGPSPGTGRPPSGVECRSRPDAGTRPLENLIGNGMYTLLRHPEEMAELQENPELIRSAVGELLRLSLGQLIGIPNNLKTRSIWT